MRKYVGLLILMLPVFGFGQSANDLIARAERLINENHWEQAIRDYETVLDNYGGRLNPLQKANIYNSLGLLNLNLLDPGKAEYYLNLSIQFHEENQIPSPIDYATALKNLGMVYLDQAEYDLAKDYLEKSIEIFKREEGEHSVDYAVARCDLGILYEEVGYYGLSYDIYKESLSILEENHDEISPEYAEVCSHMGRIMFLNGRTTEATDYINKSRSIYKQLGPNFDVPRAEALEDLGKFYEDMGNYAEAEKMLLEALQIKQSIPDEAEILIIEIINDLGILYMNTRNYRKSEEMFLQVIRMTKENLGTDHRFYATANNNMGTISTNMGRFMDAKNYLLIALATYDKRYGPNHPLSANTLNNLARVERVLGNIDLAESYYRRVLAIDEKLFGKDHPDYATTLINLAILYSSIGEEGKADPYYQEAISIRKRVLGVNHPAYASALGLMGLHSLAQGKLVEAERFFREGIEIQIGQIRSVFPVQTERQRQLFYADIRSDIQRYNYVALQLLDRNPDLIKYIFDFQIKTKAILLSSSERVRDKILGGTDAQLKNEYLAWQEAKADLANYYQLGNQVLAERNVNLRAAERRVEEMEKALMLKMTEFKSTLPQENENWRSVWALLEPDEAVVEIVSVREFKANRLGGSTVFGFTDFTQYLAIILTPNTINRPEYVILGDDFRTEEAHYAQYKNSMMFDIAQTETYEKYWKPIHDKLGNAKRVMVSPDGIFFKMNPNAFQITSEKFVIDDYYVSYLTSCKDLFRESPANLSNKAWLFGNPDFGFSESGLKLESLPGAEEEIKEIGKTFGRGWTIRENIHDMASELRLRSAATTSPTILHIATHGFFGERNNFLSTLLPTNMPLFNSGLFLTGASTTYDQFLKGISTPTENDGILTAQEAMNLDLRKTKLVVLSACETGLGKVENGEGVYGLQRAFMIAGARYLITSYAKVDDDLTNELMQLFYKRFMETDKIDVSFEYAQKKLREKYRAASAWGSFILIGNG